MCFVSVPEYVQMVIFSVTYAGGRVQSATVYILQQQWHYIPMVIVLNCVSGTDGIVAHLLVFS